MIDTKLKPGLEDVAVATTRLSSIDGEHGALVIGGYPIAELAPNATYEESVYLLLNDRLPDEEELERFRRELADRRSISEEVASILRQAATEEASAMDALRMGLSAATLQSNANDGRETAHRLIAVVPTIVAAYWRFRQGKVPVTPRLDLGHAANLLYMMWGEDPAEDAVRGLETYLNTVIDHGLNASTFTARTVVSTESDLVSAATAAAGALKGPLHGGAPGPVLDMLKAVHQTGDPEGFVRDILENGERVMGFGHRVYRARDPRAEVLSSAAERFYSRSGRDDFFETAKELERVGTKLLLEYKPDRPLKTNVEFYTAVLLHGIGIPRELFTATFAAARMGGWMAHILEQKRDNQLVRPTSHYDGDTGRVWTPVQERRK